MNHDVDFDDEPIRQVTLPVGQVVEQMLLAAETIVRTSAITDDERARIQEAIATLNATLNKNSASAQQPDRSAYGRFDPSMTKLTLEEMKAFVDS
jgi:hypothetical protein